MLWLWKSLSIFSINRFIFLANLLISSICAVILFVAITSNINLDPQFNAPGYSMVLLFAGVSGIIFVYYNRDVWLLKQALRYKKLGCAQEKRLTALAGSIAHEVRNPLNAISLSANQIRNFTNEAKGKREMDRMDCVIEILFSSIKRSNNIIDAILGQLKGQKIDDRNFKYYSVK